MKTLENEVFNELNRLNACYTYPSLNGFVVYVDTASGNTVIYAEGFEVKADTDVLEALRCLPDEAGANAVCAALEKYEI